MADSKPIAEALIENQMHSIRQFWGTQLAAAVATSSIPEALLAAIVGNESGGHASPRFEPAIYHRLADVAGGLSAAFSPPGIRRPLTAAWLLAYASPGELDGAERVAEMDCTPFPPSTPGAPARGLQWGLKRLRELATSYGLTQVMGWHLLEMAGLAGWKFTIADLSAPAANLKAAVLLLSYFGDRYQLDLEKEFPDLLRCWNTGQPTGTTFDPEYVTNGLARMAAYAAAAPTSGTGTGALPAPPLPPASPSA